MVRRQRAANGAASTLSAAVLSSATTWPMTAVSSFANEGDFYVARGTEIVKVTHVVGLNFTVVRAQLGTVAIDHAIGSSVTSIVTKEEFENRRLEAGQLKTLDYGILSRKDGVILTAADFTGQGSTPAILQDANDGNIHIAIGANGTNEGRLRGGTRPVTAGVDRDYYAHASVNTLFDHVESRLAFMYRQSTGGAMKGMELKPDNRIATGEQGSWLSNVFSTTNVTHGSWGRSDCWFRCKVRWDVVASTDNFTWGYSWDGVHWIDMHTHGFAAGAGTIGIWASNGRSTTGTTWDNTVQATIHSWYQQDV